MTASSSESPYPAMRTETFFPGRLNPAFDVDDKKKGLVTTEFFGFVMR
jgi:hypothetical protein